MRRVSRFKWTISRAACAFYRRKGFSLVPDLNMDFAELIFFV